MADFLLQEDGASHLLKEDGASSILLDSEISIPFIASATVVYTPTLSQTLTVPFVATASAVYAPALHNSVHFVGATSLGAGPGADATVISVPAGVVDGDLLIAAFSDLSSTPGGGAASGWTLRTNIANGNNNLSVLTKIASSEPSSYTFTFSGGTTPRANVMLAYRGVGASGAPDASTTSTSSANGVSATPSGVNDLEVHIVAAGSAGSLSAATNLTQRAYPVAAVNQSLFAEDRLNLPTSAATGTITPGGTPGSNPLNAHLLFSIVRTRVSQEAVEALYGTASAKTRVAQEAVEALYGTQGAHARVSQVVFEALVHIPLSVPFITSVTTVYTPTLARVGPTYSVLDDFNRADENPLSGGGNWINKIVSTDANLKLVSNKVLATSAARCGAYWAAAADSEVFLTLSTLPVSDGVGVWLRATHPGTASASGYMAWWEPSGPTLRIWKVTNGGFTAIATQIGPSFVAGDKLWLRAVGNVLTLATFHGGVWADQLTVTDTTYAGGYIGIFGGADTTWRADDFGGGAVPPSGPRSAVLDDFNRADENPLSDAGAWTNHIFSGDGNLKLVSNKALATSSARDGAYWNAQQFDGSEAFLTLSTLPVLDGSGLWVRVTNPGTANASGYMAWWLAGNGIRIWRADNGVFTPLTTYADPDLAAGDKLWFRAIGSRLTLALFHNGVWGNWLTVTDTTYASGYIGIFGGADTTYRVDDFGGGPDFTLSFITSVTAVYALTTPGTLAVPFIASATQVYTPALVGYTTVPFITSVTAVFAPSVKGPVDVPFIASVTVVYTPKLQLDVPFIGSVTVVYPILSLFTPGATGVGPGNGGELFQVALAANGATETATLDASITSGATSLMLTGDSGMPLTPFCVTIDSEILYITTFAPGQYRVRARGVGNTTAASHTVGATVTWDDSYDMAITSSVQIHTSFTADITGSGSQTYPGWLLCFDSTQAYLGGSRYPMHVTDVLGVFDAGAGTTGTNRLDAAQPNAICVPATTSEDCPAALSNPARISTNIAIGDVAVVRYTNPEASTLVLGSRSAALQSWFGMKRVDDTDNDVTFTDTTGHVVDTDPGVGDYTGSVDGEWTPPVLGPGVGPSTGLPTSHDVPYTSVTLPGSDRFFTDGIHYSEKGWPIACLAVRQGTRRIPFWASWDWKDFNYSYSGFGTDATFCQLLINRNGMVYGAVPEVDLPGAQDIDGPDTVWDDGSYYFATAWYVAIWAGSYLTIGPSIGGTSSSPSGSDSDPVPTVDFTGGTTTVSTPTTSGPPPVEGGSGGGVDAPAASGLNFWARF